MAPYFYVKTRCYQITPKKFNYFIKKYFTFYSNVVIIVLYRKLVQNKEDNAMLEWNEVSGYNSNVSYHENQKTVNLPELREEILIKTLEYDRIFQGRFTKSWAGKSSDRILVSDGYGERGQLKDGIKWARFNLPE